MKYKFKDLVGHKLIYNKYRVGVNRYIEVIVVEMSPSGKRVKLKYPSDADIWEEMDSDGYYGVNDNDIVEDLGIISYDK